MSIAVTESDFTAPETVAGIHRQYIAAGSRVIYANTFGANRRKLAGTGHTAAEVVAAAVRVAREAAGDSGVRVALDIGPIGELLAPLGTLDFDEAADIFREMVAAGAGAAILSAEDVRNMEQIRIFHLKPPLYRENILVRRQGAEQADAIQTMEDLLMSQAETV